MTNASVSLLEPVIDGSAVLDIGVAKLVPLPPDQWIKTPTDSQQETWELIHKLATAVEGKVSEQGLAYLLNLKSLMPLRCRIERLVENKALAVL